MKPLVSIIIPTFNSQKFIPNLYNTISKQSYENYEIIFVDNESKDETISLIKNFFKKKIKIINIKNHGVIGKSRNIGIKFAKGKFISFLDSDDFWTTDKLKNSIEIISKNKSDIFFSNFYLNDFYKKKISRGRSYNLNLKNKNFTKLMISYNPIVTSSVVCRKEIFNSFKFSEDPKLIGLEDFDLWLKLAKKNLNFSYSRNRLTFITIHNDNTYHKRYRQLIYSYDFLLQKYLLNLDPLIKKKAISNFNYIKSGFYYRESKKLGRQKLIDVILSEGTLAIRFKSFIKLILSFIK